MAVDRPEPSARLEAERSAAQRELEEIALLLGQARSEAERHTARQVTASERFSALLDEAGASPEVREAHQQLVVQMQRAALMTAQLEVLEGKQRLLERLVADLDVVRGVGGEAGLVLRSTPEPATGAPSGASNGSRAVLAAQEEMRRAIARQMHDGPAQSIANIALQAQVVERLLARNPATAQKELAELRSMVQRALEATKTFIFDVRPMVLDDLGLLPTLRRAADERARRSGVRVRFTSAGTDRRLAPELETGLFRIVDDALGSLVAATPAEIALELNWSDDQVAVSLRTQPPPITPSAEAGRTGLWDEELPPALAEMIKDQAGGITPGHAGISAYAITAELWAALEERAATVGIELERSPDGLEVVATLRTPNGTA